MASDRVSQVLLRYKVAKEDIATLKADLASIKAAMGTVDEEAHDTSTGIDTFRQRLTELSRANQVEQLGTDFGKMAAKIGDADSAAQQLQARLKSIGATESEVQSAAGSFFAASQPEAGGRSGLSTLGRNIRNLPSIQIPGAGGLGTDAIGNLLRVFGALPPAILPVVAIIGAVGAGFVLLQKQLEGSKQALDNARSSTAAYYDAIANQTTTEEAKKRIEDLQRDIAAKQADIDNATRATSDAFKAAQEQYGDALARVMFAVGGITPNTEDAQKELTKMQGELQGLTRATQDGTTAAADLAEQERKVQEIRDKLADQTIARETQVAQLLRNGTEEQVQGRIDALQDENMAIVEVIAAGKLSQTELDKLSDKLGENNATLQELQTNVIDVVRARDKEIQSAKDQAAAMADIDKINQQLTDAALKRTQDITAINEKYADSLAKLKTNFEQANLDAQVQQQQKLADLAQKYQQQQTDDNQKYREKQADLQQKYNDSGVKIEEAYRKKILEIENRFTLDSQDAIQNRDAVALDAAERRRKADLQSAQSQHTEDQQQRERDYQQQLRDLQQSNERQQRERQNDYIRRVQEAQLAFQREDQQRQLKYQRDQQQLQQAQAQEINQRNQAYYQQLRDLNTYLSQRIATDKAYFGAVLAYAQQTKQKVDSLFGSSAAGTALGTIGTISPGVTGFGGFKGFADGGRVTQTGLALVHKDEVILNPRQQNMMNLTFAPSLRGANAGQIRREFATQLEQFLKMAGVV